MIRLFDENGVDDSLFPDYNNEAQVPEEIRRLL